MRKTFILAMFLFACGGILAHEFWIAPVKFHYQLKDTLQLRLLVGEGFTGENWGVGKEKLKRLDLISANANENMLDQYSPDSLQPTNMALHHEGTQVIVFNNKGSYIELEPEKFNAYLTEDGLYNAIEWRKTHQQDTAKGKEWYQRSVKSIIQVGSKFSDVYRQPTGLPLDIILLKNPYSLQKETECEVLLLFNGKPLPNTLVRLWQKINTNVSMKDFHTDDSGKIKVNILPAGNYMISAVYMEQTDKLPGHLLVQPSKSGESADWQSFWGSLTFGYD